LDCTTSAPQILETSVCLKVYTFTTFVSSTGFKPIRSCLSFQTFFPVLSVSFLQFSITFFSIRYHYICLPWSCRRAIQNVINQFPWQEIFNYYFSISASPVSLHSSTTHLYHNI